MRIFTTFGCRKDVVSRTTTLTLPSRLEGEGKITKPPAAQMRNAPLV